MLAIAPGGFEEVESDDWLELALYTDADGEGLVRATFDRVSTTAVEPGWEDRWRAFHHAIVAGGLWIGPPWEDAPDHERAIVVDPGRAFGTGAHPTTRACVELLARGSGGSCLDAGCGSGVLAVAAMRLGYAPVVAVDIDPVAVEAASATAQRNGVTIDVRLADVLCDGLPQTDVLVANIELATVGVLLERSTATTAVTSGYLDREAPIAPRWRSAARVELEGWAADLLVAL